MLVGFDIIHYDEVYEALVRKLGYMQDVFETDDVILLENMDELKEIKTALPHIKFTI